MLNVVGLGQHSLAAQEQQQDRHAAGQRWPWVGLHSGSSGAPWGEWLKLQWEKSKCCKLAEHRDRVDRVCIDPQRVSAVVTQLATNWCSCSCSFSSALFSCSCSWATTTATIASCQIGVTTGLASALGEYLLFNLQLTRSTAAG